MPNHKSSHVNTLVLSYRTKSIAQERLWGSFFNLNEVIALLICKGTLMLTSECGVVTCTGSDHSHVLMP